MNLVNSRCFGSVAVLLLGCASPRVNQPVQADGGAPEPAEEQLYSLTVVEEGYDVTVTELERGPNYSLLAFKQTEAPTVTGGGMVMFKAVVDIAKERGFEYFFLNRERAGPNEAQAANQESLLMRPFFTNDNMVPLKELLGDTYSEAAQGLFDRQGYVSVSQMAVLFGGPRPDSVLVSPQRQGQLDRRGIRQRAYYAALKSALKNLASQEEIYFSEHGTYTDNTVSLVFISSQGVTVTITASTDGWAATATHVALPSAYGCAIYHGTATAPTSPIQPMRPDEPACTDGDPLASRLPRSSLAVVMELSHCQGPAGMGD